LSPAQRRSLAAVSLAAAYIVTVYMLRFVVPPVTTGDPNANQVKLSFLPPGADPAFPLGTDQLGRDMLLRLLIGGSKSLEISFVAVVISIAFGGTLGIVSAYLSGWFDIVANRLSEIQFSFPAVLLGLVILSLGGGGYWPIVLVIALAGWPMIFRLTRAAVLPLRNAQFIQAAQIAGVPRGIIVVRHLLPPALPVITTAGTIEFSRNLLLIASLNYLGLGVQPPDADWSQMIAFGQAQLGTAWWIPALPAMALITLVYAANALGDSLQGLPRVER